MTGDEDEVKDEVEDEVEDEVVVEDENEVEENEEGGWHIFPTWRSNTSTL